MASYGPGVNHDVVAATLGVILDCDNTLRKVLVDSCARRILPRMMWSMHSSEQLLLQECLADANLPILAGSLLNVIFCQIVSKEDFL